MKTDKDIEMLLQAGKAASLNVHDKANIKSSLLEQASKTLVNENRAIFSPWSAWIFRGSLSFASLLLVFTGTAFAAKDSLPGEPLYGMKVHIVEEVIAFTKVTATERVAYDIELLETRFKELEQLTDQEEWISSEHLDVLTEQIAEQIADVTNEFEDTVTEDISYPERIKTLTKVSAIVKAQEEIIIDEFHQPETLDSVTTMRENVSLTKANTIEDFIENETAETVQAHLHDEISAIGTQIDTSSSTSASLDTTESYLLDLHEALAEGNIVEALISASEAQEHIITEQLNIRIEESQGVPE